MPRIPFKRRVPCSSCGAAIGAPCLTADGQPFTKSRVHPERAALAAQTTAPEMAWLLSTCSATAPGLAWRLDGSAVVAERNGSEVRVTLSRIVVSGAVSMKRLTRRNWLAGTLAGVLTVLGDGASVAMTTAPIRGRLLPCPPLETVQAAAPRLTWRLSPVGTPTATVKNYRITVNCAFVRVFYDQPHMRGKIKHVLTLHQNSLRSTIQQALTLISKPRALKETP